MKLCRPVCHHNYLANCAGGQEVAKRVFKVCAACVKIYTPPTICIIRNYIISKLYTEHSIQGDSKGMLCLFKYVWFHI